jgi:hypothetical protein
VHKKVFTFELNVNTEPPTFVLALLDLHAQYKDQQKTIASMRKSRKEKPPTSDGVSRRTDVQNLCNIYLV